MTEDPIFNVTQLDIFSPAAGDYPLNVNLKKPYWLQYLIIGMSIINLSIVAFTVVFQLSNPKSMRNMGRFFMLILILQTFGKVNILIQEVFFDDLSLPFYQIQQGLSYSDKSFDTNFCQLSGGFSVFNGFLSQFYCLWLAVLIKQILKDPIHRLNRYMYTYHFITIMISLIFTWMLSVANNFGVEETLQCGLMTTPGLNDEYLMILPFILVPVQLWLILKIMRQTPFIVRESLKKFVTKYSVAMVSLMLIECMKVIMIFFGSTTPNYYSYQPGSQYQQVDGYAYLRYSYQIAEQVSFTCLAICTLCEPTFYEKLDIFWAKYIRKTAQPKIIPGVESSIPSSSAVKKPIRKGSGQKKSLSLINSLAGRRVDSSSDFDINSLQSRSLIEGGGENEVLLTPTDILEDDDDDWEGGNNMKNDQPDDDENDQQFNDLVKMNPNTGLQLKETMTLQQKSNQFIINSVLMSICSCVLAQKKANVHSKIGEVGSGLMRLVKVFTYQMQDNDLNYIMDIADFYKQNPSLCVSDITNGKKVQIKITEFGPEILKKIRHQSGFSDDFLIKAFAPFENQDAMEKFGEGTGKSASFFFFTENKQFVIKTLKDEELDLLARKGVLEKYYDHIHKYPKSLIARFYGIYTIKIKYMKPISVIIMDNLMGNHAEQITRIYDLKGSTFQRITHNPASNKAIRKDLNILQETDYRVHVNEVLHKDLLQRIAKDKEFLKSCHLMDYSLMLVFFRKSDSEMMSQEKSSDSGSGSSYNIFNSVQSNPDPQSEHVEPGNSQTQRPTVNHNNLFEIAEEEEIKDDASENSRNQMSPDNEIQRRVGTTEPFLQRRPTRVPTEIELGNLQRKPSVMIPIEQSQGLRRTSIIGQGLIGILKTSNLVKRIARGLIANPLKKVMGVEETVDQSTLKPKTKEFIQYRSNTEDTVYYRMGIIDFLQKYNKRKLLETKWLTMRNRTVDPETFSCVDPKLYGDRFLKFMSANVFTGDVIYQESDVHNIQQE